MPKAQYQHNLILDEELESAWKQRKAEQPDLKFNPFVTALLREALCVTVAPTLTTR